jgi:regulator of sigma E protease
MHAFLVSAAAFIVLVGIMVVVHEFGHFAVAKLCGVRVEAFSVGFGPRLFGVKYGDTDYKVCLLPLGGYVKMTGENPGDTDATGDPRAFSAHPRWQRMLIGLAGPVSNFILAFVAMTLYYNWINEVPKFEVKDTAIEWVADGSAAAKAGFESGDVVRHFDTEDDPSWYKIYARANLNLGQTVPVTVERGGKTVQLSLYLPPAEKSGDFDVSDVGIYPQQTPGPIGVQRVQLGTPADKAGIRPGDAIESVDGHPFHTLPALIAYLQAGQGKAVSLVVERAGAALPPIEVNPIQIENGWKLGFEAVLPPMINDPLPFDKAMAKSRSFCADSSTLILEVLQRIFQHRVSVSQLSGPVGIARMAGQAAEMKGWLPKVGLGAEISLNLGILNLLPFPILDGGLILLLLIESVLRHDINLMVKERIYQAAFVVLVAFAAFIIFNDVTKLRH